MTPPSESGSALARARAAHLAAFGQARTLAALAPGRVNLIGEHTDYNDGLVCPIAIPLCAAAVCSARTDTRLRIIAADLDPAQRTFECDLAALDPASLRGRAAAYAVGPARLLFELRGDGEDRGHSGGGADLALASDVPLGAGLSSSAALEVAVATALAALWGIDLAPLDLARLCQRAEHEFAGVPCGLMDQLASVSGRPGCAMRIDCRDNTIEHIPLPPPERATLVVANSGVRHALASGEYAQRRAACHAAAAALRLTSLRDADESMLNAAAGRLTADQLACATHVVAENARVRVFADALRAGDLAAAGAQMHASHASLRDLYRVSCPELDMLVAIAMSAPGVYGSRMTGGGFGGCTITLCEPAAVAPLTAALHTRYRAAHGRDCAVFSVTASRGARLVNADAATDEHGSTRIQVNEDEPLMLPDEPR